MLGHGEGLFLAPGFGPKRIFKGENAMDEITERPGTEPIRYKGFEIYLTGIAEGETAYGEFEIWKGSEKLHQGRVDEPSGRMDRAMIAAEDAAKRWIDAQFP